MNKAAPVVIECFFFPTRNKLVSLQKVQILDYCTLRTVVQRCEKDVVCVCVRAYYS
jgi:hypothetical protein